MKALKWTFGILAGLVALLVIAAAIVAATFDPNRYKPEIVDLVKSRTGRTLSMDGNIALTFFPRIGAHVERVALSGPGGKGTFARVEDARVAVALWPLLSRQLIVDRVTLTGLAVDLVRFKDGRTNFDDLAGKGAKPEGKPAPKAPAPERGAPLAIDIAGVALKNATIGWRDEGAGTDLRLSQVALETGRIASGVPGKLQFAARVEGKQPAANVRVELDTGYRIDFQSLATALSGLDLRLSGDAAGMTGIEARLRGQKVDLDPASTRIDLDGVELDAKSKDGLDAKFSIPRLALSPDRAESKAINGLVKLARPGETVDAKLALSALEAKGKQINFSRFDLDLDAKTGDLSVQGKMASPVALNLEASQVQLPGLAGDLTVSGPTIPNKSLKIALKGGARADWAKRSANADLAARLDDSNIQAKVAVANWAAPAVTFDVTADRLNVDRYLPPKAAAVAPASGAAKGQGAAPPTAKAAASPADETPIDLSALKTLNASGNIRIGALQVSNIKAETVAVALKAAGGRLDASPVSATLYQGSLNGAAAVNANNNTFALKQTLANVSVGPLLRDAANQDVLEGRGTVTLDVTATGSTVTALKKALAGSASVALKDGAVKGVDIADAIRQAQALLGSKRALEQTAKGGRKTDFTDLTASFVIRNGVARNDDLKAASPLLRLAGAGDIDIGEGRLDYLVKATVVATSTGQGGKDLSQVAGVTVPVKLTGPFDNLSYTVDAAALAAEVAKGALQREIERRLGGGAKAGEPQPGGGAGGIEDALRGLFGRKK
jgi:AsmA protein